MITWEIPIKTVSESNSNEHWYTKRHRHKSQQFYVNRAFRNETREMPIPCVITLIRVSSRPLDVEENLPMAFKWIKDELGACLFPEKVVVYQKKNGAYVRNKGFADSDPRVTWKYAQEKGDILGIRIQIEPRDP